MNQTKAYIRKKALMHEVMTIIHSKTGNVSGEMFFTLAFRTERELKQILRELTA